MTQEVITDIKQKEKGKEEEEEATSQYMSAVAQYCIDNNPDMTWRRIMITLIDAKELVLLRQFLTDLECSCTVAKGIMPQLLSFTIIMYNSRYKFKCWQNSEKSHEKSFFAVKKGNKKLASDLC